MSWVTDVIITCSSAEYNDIDDLPPPIEELNAWLLGETLSVLTDLAPHFGGNKWPQVCVWGGSFNYLGLGDFEYQIGLASWREPENVVVLIKDEEDERVQVWDRFPTRST